MPPLNHSSSATHNAPDANGLEMVKLARAAVQALQVAWQQEDWDAVSALFHPDAMLLPPDMGPIIHSRGDIVASYQEFMAQAQMHAFAMTDCQVQPFAQSCMVQCAFDIEFSLGSQRESDRLQEIYLLEQRDRSALQIVWRQQLLDPGTPGEHA
ncbi:MAG: nuclear transport factor 2 family protein [Pseudomonadales bacterium]